MDSIYVEFVPRNIIQCKIEEKSTELTKAYDKYIFTNGHSSLYWAEVKLNFNLFLYTSLNI